MATKIVFNSDRDSNHEVYVMNTDGANQIYNSKRDKKMIIIGMQELKNRISEILRSTSKHDIIITSRGKPIAMMVKFTEDDLADYVLVEDSELKRGIEEGLKEADAGKLTPIDDVIAELEARRGKVQSKPRR